MDFSESAYVQAIGDISLDKCHLAAAGHNSIKLYDIKSSSPAAVLTFEGHSSSVPGIMTPLPKVTVAFWGFDIDGNTRQYLSPSTNEHNQIGKGTKKRKISSFADPALSLEGEEDDE
ncbi:hypothetical protein EJ08DRAFT_701429 [Tothia fuscella]|uniref:Uncharacterized protein n=1 Tax=Tothia fuscella TaxID=1048955 RepID=A0A9P4NIQ9_9PEZI|nr:hypothetical protein EJ08DRAFT_701429 [Tothia fuscella]